MSLIDFFENVFETKAVTERLFFPFAQMRNPPTVVKFLFFSPRRVHCKLFGKYFARRVTRHNHRFTKNR